TFGIYSNGAYVATRSGGDARAYLNAVISDCTVTVKVNKFNDSGAMIVRYIPADDSGYILGTSGKLERFIGGNYFLLATNNTFVNGDVVKTVLNGSLI